MLRTPPPRLTPDLRWYADALSFYKASEKHQVRANQTQLGEIIFRSRAESGGEQRAVMGNKSGCVGALIGTW